MLAWLYWDSHNLQGRVDFLNAGHCDLLFSSEQPSKGRRCCSKNLLKQKRQVHRNSRRQQDNRFLKGEGVGSFFTSFLNKRRRVKRISEEGRIRRQIIFTVRIGLEDITSVLGRFSQPRVWLSPHDVR
jgi:hypothetical protein